MKKRLSALLALKKEGVVTETPEGFVKMGDASKAKPLFIESLKRKYQLKELDPSKTVQEENRDRDQLYDEVVSHNKLAPARKADVQKSFARSIQNADGQSN